MGLGEHIDIPCRVGDKFWAVAYKEQEVTRVECIGYVVNVDIPLRINNRYIWVSSVENPNDYWKVDFQDFENQCFETQKEATRALRNKGRRR